MDIRSRYWSMLLARITCSNRQWKERKVQSCVCLWGSRESTMELCSIVSGRPRVLYGESLGRHTRVYTRACSVHVRSDRTTDGRYSIAVCRICSLCRDHILVLIRAPDKIALCYRGSCLRDPRENHHRCAFTYGLPRVLLFPSPFVSALSANPLAKKKTEIARFRGESRRICESDRTERYIIIFQSRI